MTKKKATKKRKVSGLQKFTAKKRAFLRAYAETANITYAARAGKCSRNAHYRWLTTDQAYQETFQEAKQEAIELLEGEARRRAVEGVEELIVHQGQIQKGEDGTPASVRRYSDILLIFLMKGAMPEVYRDNFHITGSVELEAVVGKLAAGRKRITKAEEAQDVVVEAVEVEGE